MNDILDVVALKRGAMSDLMTARLEIAREVAWTKFHTEGPIYDPVREGAVVRDFTARAAHAGVDPRLAEAFITAQVAASREVQVELIEGWKHGSPRPTTRPRDLKTEIRPQLDRISLNLETMLRWRGNWSNSPADVSAMEGVILRDGFSAAVARLAMRW